MKIHMDEFHMSGFVVEDSPLGWLRVGPTQVHNFQQSRPVLLLEGPKRRPRLIGTVLGSWTGTPRALVGLVLKADADYKAFLGTLPKELEQSLENRTWVLDLASVVPGEAEG